MEQEQGGELRVEWGRLFGTPEYSKPRYNQSKTFLSTISDLFGSYLLALKKKVPMNNLKFVFFPAYDPDSYLNDV